MKIVKRIAAACLAAVLALSMSGCHKANEIAASYDDIEITSGMYLAMLLEADGNARNLVDEQNTDENGDKVSVSDYGKMTVSTDDGDVAYYDYVKDEAKKLVRQYIATEVLAKENKVTLSDEDKSGLETYVNYYWNNYGYKTMYEANGVGLDSYTDYMRNAGYLRGNLFTAIYGKDGTTPVPEDELSEYMNKNYCIADVISESLSSTDSDGNTTTLTEDEAAELLEKLKGYADRINNGESFETVYHEYTGKEHEDADKADAESTDDTSSDTSSETDETADEEKELTPLDSHATLIYGEETGYDSYNSVDFDEVYKMKVGEVKVIETDESYSLVVKGDIAADPYYLQSLDETLRQLVKGDEFNDLLDKKGGELDIKYNNSEIRYLNPKKITYDVY